jgi:hypothetical protein
MSGPSTGSQLDVRVIADSHRTSILALSLLFASLWIPVPPSQLAAQSPSDSPDVDRAADLGAYDQVAAPVGDPGHESFYQSPLRRHRYSGFWPFYSSEEFEDGRTETRALLGAIRFDSDLLGGRYHRVLPFYAASSQPAARRSSLQIYPILWFQEQDGDEGFAAWVPFWWQRWWTTGDRTIVWPLAWMATNPRKNERWIPTLWRSMTNTLYETSSSRFGVPYLLDVYARARWNTKAGPVSAWSVGVLPAIGDEARSGLALARGRSSELRSDFHVFPLVAAGAPRSAALDGARRHRYFGTPFWWNWSRDAVDPQYPSIIVGIESGWSVPILFTGSVESPDGWATSVVFPLAQFVSREMHKQVLVTPFWLDDERERIDSEGRAWTTRTRFFSFLYGQRNRESANGVWTDHYLPPLLSRYGSLVAPPERDGFLPWKLDVLYPLIHFERDSAETFARRVFPLFSASKSDDTRDLSIGVFLWRDHERFSRPSRRNRWALFPIFRWSEWEHRTLRWALPFWIDFRSRDPDDSWSLSAILPFYVGYERETVDVRESIDLWAPFWFSASSDARDSTEDEFRPDSRSRQVWPFFGYRNEWVNGTQTLAEHDVLFPFFGWGWSDLAPGSPEESTRIEWRTQWIDAPWPFVRHESNAHSWSFRIFPALFIGSGHRYGYTTVWPIASVHRGEESSPGIAHDLSLVQVHDTGRSRALRIVPVLPLVFHEDRHYTEYGETEYVDATALLWLAKYRRTEHRSWFHVLPFALGEVDGERSRIGVFPFYYRRDFGSEPIDRWDPLRFLFVWNSFESAEERHSSILWKAISMTSGRREGHDFRIFHRLFVHREIDGQSELVINPFFSTFSDERSGEKELTILKFLYTSRTTGGETERRLLWIIPLP